MDVEGQAKAEPKILVSTCFFSFVPKDCGHQAFVFSSECDLVTILYYFVVVCFLKDNHTGVDVALKVHLILFICECGFKIVSNTLYHY